MLAQSRDFWQTGKYFLQIKRITLILHSYLKKIIQSVEINRLSTKTNHAF